MGTQQKMSTKFVHRTRCLCHRPINTDQYRSVIINVCGAGMGEIEKILNLRCQISIFFFRSWGINFYIFCVIYNVATQKICVMGKNCVVSISYWIVDFLHSVQKLWILPEWNNSETILLWLFVILTSFKQNKSHFDIV